ncbi:MAG: molybdenum cofactor guanylyltransferase [Hormoscilla sp. SP12CHS1]|nr:molybdenum cofactor guanylyltransferase [Hormoscilla sp. SP12CHS1]
MLPQCLRRHRKSSAIKLTAIVLAGGKSGRMGKDKALIPIEGMPLIGRICNIAKSCSDLVYVVTSWPERYREIIPNDCHLIPEVPIAGESQPSGPLVGFVQGLVHVESDWVLLLACDLPQLRADVLQDWVVKLTAVQREAIALLVQQEWGWEPLCGFYRRSCLPELTQFIQQGGRSFQQFLASQTVAELPLGNPEMLFNCNTPADLEELKIEN